MSTLTADPGFARGQVLGILWKAYDSESGDGSHVVGTRKVFRDEDPKTGKLLSNRTVECICVKNTSGDPLLPRTIARLKPAAIMTEVDLLATPSDSLFGVVDEYLPAAGVPDGEVFWLVVRGPATVSYDETMSAGESVGVGAGGLAAYPPSDTKLLGYAIEDTTGGTIGRILVSTAAGL